MTLMARDEPAPSARLEVEGGRAVELSEYFGEPALVLIFLRHFG